MKIVVGVNYIIRSFKDLQDFIKDHRAQGLGRYSSYFYSYDTERFSGGGGLSLVLDRDKEVKWGHVSSRIINNLEEIKEHMDRSLSPEFKNYKIIYYSKVKTIKYNKDKL